jgi:hypothetical protein
MIDRPYSSKIVLKSTGSGLVEAGAMVLTGVAELFDDFDVKMIPVAPVIWKDASVRRGEESSPLGPLGDGCADPLLLFCSCRRRSLSLPPELIH